MNYTTLKITILNPRVINIIKDLAALDLIDILEEYDSKSIYDTGTPKPNPKVKFDFFKSQPYKTRRGQKVYNLSLTKSFPSIEVKGKDVDNKVKSLILHDVINIHVPEVDFTSANGFTTDNHGKGSYEGDRLKFSVSDKKELWLASGFLTGYDENPLVQNHVTALDELIRRQVELNKQNSKYKY